MSTALLPSISVSNPGYSGLSLEVYTGIPVSDKVNEDLTITLYPDVSVSNLRYTLGVNRSTLISVSDKVYEDLSATLFPGVSVSNTGYNGLSPGMFLKYWSVTKYMKTCPVVCTPEYNSVYQSMMQSMEGLEFILEYLHIYKYGLKHCHLWKVKFSDHCLKNKSVC